MHVSRMHIPHMPALTSKLPVLRLPKLSSQLASWFVTASRLASGARCGSSENISDAWNHDVNLADANPHLRPQTHSMVVVCRLVGLSLLKTNERALPNNVHPWYKQHSGHLRAHLFATGRTAANLLDQFVRHTLRDVTSGARCTTKRTTETPCRWNTMIRINPHPPESTHVSSYEHMTTKINATTEKACETRDIETWNEKDTHE